MQSEILGTKLADGRPEKVGHVVMGTDSFGIFETAEEEVVDRWDIHAAIPIYIRDREKPPQGKGLRSGFFAKLAHNGLFQAFSGIDKATWKVECPFCRFKRTAAHQDTSPLVGYNAYYRGACVQVENEATITASA